MYTVRCRCLDRSMGWRYIWRSLRHFVEFKALRQAEIIQGVADKEKKEPGLGPGALQGKKKNPAKRLRRSNQ